MDPTRAEGLQAMKSYNKRNHFLYNPILHFLVALTFSLFFSFPFCFPSTSSSMEDFGLISLPCIRFSFLNPKCLFIVVNVIVVFLVGESKLTSTNSSPAGDIYREYAERNQRLMKVRTLRVTKDRKVDEEVEWKESKEGFEEETENQGKSEEDDEYEKEVELDEEKEIQEKLEETSEEKEEDKREARLPLLMIEEGGELPAEELNRRVEEFIARINMKRWLEANSLAYYEA